MIASGVRGWNEATREADGARPRAGLAVAGFTVGAMFVWVFFENLGNGLYTPGGYAGFINYFIRADKAPTVWKAVMVLAGQHASMAAPAQGFKEISLGILLTLRLFTRPAALVAFAFLASLAGSRARAAHRPVAERVGAKRLDV